MLKILTEREKKNRLIINIVHVSGGGGWEGICVVSENFSLETWVQLSAGAICGLSLLLVLALLELFTSWYTYSGLLPSTISTLNQLRLISDVTSSTDIQL